MTFQDLPIEMMKEIFEFVPMTELHSSVRYLSKRINTVVDYTLSTRQAIEYINAHYGVMWTLSGYCSSTGPTNTVDQLDSKNQSNILGVLVLFDARTNQAFAMNMSGMRILPASYARSKIIPWPQTHTNSKHKSFNIAEHRRHIQLFFRWSVHTVYTTYVQPTPHSTSQAHSLCRLGTTEIDSKSDDGVHQYFGAVDYRIILNRIVWGQSKSVSEWLIPA